MEASKSQSGLDQKEKPGPASITIPASPSMQKLGYGTGVNVYLMKRSPRGLSRSPWAVKKISSKCSKNQQNIYQSRLNEEAKILKSLQHPNIVGYRAFTEANDGSMCLVMEFGGEKSLNDLIEERSAARLGPFPAATISKVALSMARGLKQPYITGNCCNGAARLEDTFKLTDTVKAEFSVICQPGHKEHRFGTAYEKFYPSSASNLQCTHGTLRCCGEIFKYLHNDKKLLHGDIKSPNVVVKGDFEAIKICDVGVSLPLDENMTVSDPTVHYIGTEPWKPKEALSDDGVITDKADIFSFGLTLWEMMTLSVPHLNLGSNTDDEDESFDEDDFDEEAYYAALGTQPALNMDELDSSYQQVIELFSVCTSEDPKKRPSAAHVVAVLEASLPPELRA